MKKYIAFFKAGLASVAMYRAELVFSFIRMFIKLGILVYLWIAVFSSQDRVGTYSLQQMVIYYSSGSLLYYITRSHLSNRLPGQIRNGQIASDLLKPYNFLLVAYFRRLSVWVRSLFSILPLVLIGLVFVYFNKEVQLGGWENIVFAFMLCFFAYTLDHLMEFFLSLFAFWFEVVWFLKHFKKMVTEIFAGVLFPLSLLSTFWQDLFSKLPFRYIYDVPVNYVVGKRDISTNGLGDLLTIGLWIIFFIGVTNLTWQLGLKKYEAVGN